MDPRRQVATEAMAETHTPAFLRLALFSIVSFFAITLWGLVRLAPYASGHGWLFAGAALAGLVAADFASGLAHWSADTWGKPSWPVVGAAIIRPFRIHHLDPLEITRFGFLPTNGMNCLVSLPFLCAGAFLPLNEGDPARLAGSAFLLSMMLWVMATNQFHQWAHLPVVPGWVRTLQSSGLILGVEHHQLHHTPPFTRYYCITNGWMNPLLTTTRFFRGLEWVITRTTGALPRENDLALTGANEADDPHLAPSASAVERVVET